MKNLFLVFLFFFIGFGCSKIDENDPIIINRSEITGILRIEGVEQMQEIVSTLDSLDYDGIIAFQQEHGYHSWGTACEDIYAAMDSTRLSDTTYVINYVAANSDYLELLPDSANDRILVPKYTDYLGYYIINENRMFIYNDTIYKIFTTGFLFSDEMDKYSEMIEIEEEDLEGLGQDGYTFVSADYSFIGNNNLKDSQSNCGEEIEYRSTNGSNRLRAVLLICPNSYNTLIGGYNLRPFKKIGGIWFRARRTINTTVNPMRFDFYGYLSTNWSDIQLNFTEIHQLSYKESRTWVWKANTGGSYHIGGFIFWADTPDVDPISYSCEENAIDL